LRDITIHAWKIKFGKVIIIFRVGLRAINNNKKILLVNL
jgi:hypothetical protein